MPKLEDLPDLNLIHAFTSRSLQNMSLVYGETADAITHRRDFLASIGVDYRDLICAKQIHASSVRYIQETDRGRGALSYDTALPDTDAFITDRKNLPLGIFTADCLSVFLYDAATPAIGLVHAGWRSTRENISAKAIQLMQEEFNTEAKNLYLGFGPCLRSCCYEVGKEFKNFFCEGLRERSGRYYLDLIEINKNQALDSGVYEKNIFDSKICTSCKNEEFYSFRREGERCGRIMSVIMLE